AGGRLRARGDAVKAEGGRDGPYSAAAAAASQLTDIRPGMEVLIVLRGQSVVDVKISMKSGGEGAREKPTGSATGSSGARARGRSARTGAAGGPTSRAKRPGGGAAAPPGAPPAPGRRAPPARPAQPPP